MIRKEPWELSKDEFYKPTYWHDPNAGRHPASGSGRLQTNQVPFIEVRQVGKDTIWYVYNPYTKEEKMFDYNEKDRAKNYFDNLWGNTVNKALAQNKPVPTEIKREFGVTPSQQVKQLQAGKTVEMSYLELQDLMSNTKKKPRKEGKGKRGCIPPVHTKAHTRRCPANSTKCVPPVHVGESFRSCPKKR